jgi:hypothetical protein
MAIERKEDKFVKMLRSYSEAIVGEVNTDEFWPDADKSDEQYDQESEKREHDEAYIRAEKFMDHLYNELGDIVEDRVKDFKSMNKLNSPALDMVLEFQSDGSSNMDLDKFGLAEFVYTTLRNRGKNADRGIRFYGK